LSILYHDISLSSAKSLDSLKSKVVEQGPHLLRTTRTMSLHASPTSYTSAVKALFPHLIDLREYFASQVRLDPLLLATLPFSAWVSLTALGIGIAAQQQQNLVVLHQFLSLEWLELIYEKDNNVRDSDIPDPPSGPLSLCLPRLRYFECRTPIRNQNKVLNFVASCQFPPECSLRLELPNFYASHSIQFNPLFERHAHAESIKLSVTRLGSVSHLPDQVHHVTLNYAKWPEAFMKIQLPQIITFRSFIPSMWTLLEMLFEFRSAHTCTPVQMRVGTSWSWTSPSRLGPFARFPKELSELRTQAQQLHPLCMYILDEDSLDVTGHRHESPNPGMEDSATQRLFGGKI
jgi:hypothetical protein